MELELKYNVEVEMTGDGVRMHIRTEGCDRVPMKVEFCLTGGCTIKGEGFIAKGKPGSDITAGMGFIEASLGTDVIEFGPAFMAHSYDSSMRGCVAQETNGFTVYFTEYTNIDKTIEIRTK